MFEREVINMIDGIRIIDGHVHTFENDEIAKKVIKAFNEVYEIDFDNCGTGSIDNVLENMEKVSIDYTVMVNFASAKIIKSTNELSLMAAKKHSNLIPFISFHPDMEGDLVELLNTYIEEGAKGIKFHTMAQHFLPTDKRLDVLYDACQKINFPIVFHCGRVSNKRLNANADLVAIEPIIQKYETLPIILTHMVDGNKEDVLRCKADYPNVYFDTSIVVTGSDSLKRYNKPSWLSDDEVVEMFDKIGYDRIVFGSDYPWGNPVKDIERIMGFNITHEQKEAIFYNNMAKLLKMY